MLTVRDILQLPEYSEAVVLAGQAGLDHAVVTMSVLETDQMQDKWPFNSRDILFISALSFIAGDVDKQCDLLRFLQRHGGSGLVLMHVPLFLKSVASRLITLADELAFPLISISSEEKSYPDMMTPVMSALFDDKNRGMSFALRLQKELYEMILAEKDIQYLISSVEKLLGKRIVLLDSNNNCIYQKEPQQLQAADLGRIIDRAVQNENKDSLVVTDELSIYYYPIIISKNYYGFLVVLDADPKDTAKLAVTMGQLGMAIALLSLKTKRLEEQREALRGKLIDDLVRWRFANEQSAVLRAYSLDIDLLSKSLLLLLDFGPMASGPGQQVPSPSIYTLVKNLAERDNPRHAVFRYEHNLLILFDAESRGAATVSHGQALGSELARQLKNNWPFDIKVGVSGCFASCGTIPQAYGEAQTAAAIGRQIYLDETCVCYDQLGAYALLADLALDEKAGAVLDAAVEQIMAYDREHKTQLYTTFAELLTNHADINAVAQKMFVHKNTIFYRKQRILQILGYDPFQPPYRLNFEIIFTIRQLKGV